MFRHAIHEEARLRDGRVKRARSVARAAIALSIVGSLGIEAETGFLSLFEWPLSENMTRGFIAAGGVTVAALQASTFARSYQVYLQRQFGGSGVPAEDVGLAIMTADLEPRS